MAKTSTGGETHSVKRAPNPQAIDLGSGVVFDPPFVLAPMDGVTHRVFREVILDHGGVGAAWTGFIRVSQQPVKPAAIRRELGSAHRDVPIGVQLMGVDPGATAQTAVNAVEAGAPMIDLNFGCPAPRVFKKQAGAALLEFPERIHALVSAVAKAVEVPVTAKIRLGVGDDSALHEIVSAIEAAGAKLLTVHARTRNDAYKHPARWEALACVREWTRLPLLGNGDVNSVADASRMLESGVDGVMIGRGAIRDPWLLLRLARHHRGAAPPTTGPEQIHAFHRRYRDGLLATLRNEHSALGQLKQIYRRLDVGLSIDADARTRLLRSQSLAELDEHLRVLSQSRPPRSPRLSQHRPAFVGSNPTS
ncbi:MAG: tRNA-dihydrouridine synthase family protein [bacterium]|nr:tRNA-dihydrouridine synthase family protein [bacterium]